MVSSTVKVSLRVVFVLLLLLAAFYVGRPLYWKISATIHEIRQRRQTVKEGISQIVLEAQRTVGWINNESDAGGRPRVRVAANRRLLQRHQQVL